MSDNPLAMAFANYQQQQRNPLLQSVTPAGSMYDRAPETAAGLLVPGNINLRARPAVRNADGSVSTVRSMSFTDDDWRVILIPTVIGNRGVVPADQAIKHYYQTGQHLGIFEHPDAADTYARALHEMQAGEYQR